MDDKYIEKMAALASAIRKGGSRAVLQLGGSGSRLAGIEMALSCGSIMEHEAPARNQP